MTLNAPILEGEIRTSQEWKQIFGKSAEIDLFQELVNKAALKKIGNKGDRYRLDFVGIIAFQKYSVVCMPKVYDVIRAADPANLSKIIRCIQKYQKRVRDGVIKQDILDGESLFDDAGPLLNVFIALLTWTQAHGIHLLESATISDTYSNIDWSHTFDNATAIHLKTGLLYTDLFGFSDTRLESILGLIQAFALLDLHSMFGAVAELWVSKFDPIMQLCSIIKRDSLFLPLHRVDIQNTILDAELHTTRDHDRELVNLLRQWFDLRGDFHRGLRLFGVNAFHTIWEDICSIVLGAEDSATKHLQIASQARHMIGPTMITLPSQRPDQILQESDDIWIVDAKWYRTYLGEYPSLPDVVKQFMYSMTVNSDYSVVANCFLVPVIDIDHEFERLGCTTMCLDEKIDERFSKIDIIGGNWDIFIEKYLSSSRSLYDKFKLTFN